MCSTALTKSLASCICSQLPFVQLDLLNKFYTLYSEFVCIAIFHEKVTYYCDYQTSPANQLCFKSLFIVIVVIVSQPQPIEGK